MTLTKSVIEAVRELPGATVAIIAQEFPDHSLAQVASAVKNARFAGRLRCERQKHDKFGGSAPGRFFVVNDPVVPTHPRISCVWDLGGLRA